MLDSIDEATDVNTTRVRSELDRIQKRTRGKASMACASAAMLVVIVLTFVMTYLFMRTFPKRR